MNLPDPLPIQPWTGPARGTARLPGSKSVTNRALALAALAEGETRLEGALFSRDTRIMLEALGKLGFATETDEPGRRIRIAGQGGAVPAEHASLHVGNAGTVARFLAAALALRPNGRFRLDGDDAMRRRPMGGLTDALESLGAARCAFAGEPGCLPFELTTEGYRGGTARVDASASSQILSALLLAAPAGGRPVELLAPGTRPDYVRMTLRMREAFGAPPPPAEPPEGRYRLDGQRYRPPPGGRYTVEPDLSAASYFWALVLLHGGELEFPGAGRDPLQGDARFADVLAAHGLATTVRDDGWRVAAGSAVPRPGGEREIDFARISDTFLTYAAAAPFLGETVRIAGIGHTRRQETDRVEGMATQLAALGQRVAAEDDALVVAPDLEALRARAIAARERGACLEADTYDDHRFAMSFAVLGTRDLLGDGRPWLAIRDPGCCAKTFPEFFDELERLRPTSAGE